MPDGLPSAADDAFLAALARAAAAIGRLDQALAGHNLLPAFLYRARLAAIRRQAGADGHAIDPWHLAALLEGLRLRMDPGLGPPDRGALFDAARHALDQYQWLVTPDFDQEGEVRRAGRVLDAAPGAIPLLAAAHGLCAWLGAGGDRGPVRSALVRFWVRHNLLCAPVPLTGAAALRGQAEGVSVSWSEAFLTALAAEAEDGLLVLHTLERAWLAARAAAAGQRSTSRAVLAIDILAAAPLVSATSLGRALGMAVKNAAQLLDRFRAAGIAVEVTHRSKRRLYGLADLAPLSEGVAPPRRPQPGRRRGRPPVVAVMEETPALPPALPPLGVIERRRFDYAGLEAAMAFADEAIRTARRNLAAPPSPRAP
jgi:biotin operon repressor